MLNAQYLRYNLNHGAGRQRDRKITIDSNGIDDCATYSVKTGIDPVLHGEPNLKFAP